MSKRQANCWTQCGCFSQWHPKYLMILKMSTLQRSCFGRFGLRIYVNQMNNILLHHFTWSRSLGPPRAQVRSCNASGGRLLLRRAWLLPSRFLPIKCQSLLRQSLARSPKDLSSVTGRLSMSSWWHLVLMPVLSQRWITMTSAHSVTLTWSSARRSKSSSWVSWEMNFEFRNASIAKAWRLASVLMFGASLQNRN